MRFKLISAFVLPIIVSVSVGCEDGFFGAKNPNLNSTDNSESDTSQLDVLDSRQHESFDSSGGRDGFGINGGQVFDFEPLQFRGEWICYDENNITRIFILSVDASRNAPVLVESIWVKKPDGSIFSLDPENPGDSGEASSYFLDDQNLAVSMSRGVTVEMKIGEQTYRADVPSPAN